MDDRWTISLCAPLLLLVFACDARTREGVESSSQRPPAAAVELAPPRLERIDFALLETDQQRRLVEARTAIGRAPGDAAARVRLAALLDQMHQLEPAAAAWRQALQLEPDSERAHHHLGRTLSAMGLAEAAVASFREAARLAPAYAPTRWRLGLELFGLGELEAAAREFEACRRLLASDPSGLAGLARVALEAGDLEAADRHLGALSERFPADGYPPQLLLRLRQRQGRSEEAAVLAARADAPSACFRDDPWLRELADARSGRRRQMAAARSALDAGDADRAIAQLEALRAADPEDVTVEALWIRALLESDRSDEALRVALDSRHAETHPRLLLAQGWVRLARREHEQALACAERALAVSPGLAAAELMRAQALQALDQRVEAVRALEALSAQGAVDQRAMLLHATLLAELGRLEDAQERFRDTTRAYPLDLEAWAGLCEVQLHAGALGAAETTLAEVRRLPGSERVARYLDERLRTATAPHDR